MVLEVTYPSPAAHDILYRGLPELGRQWIGAMWSAGGVDWLFAMYWSRIDWIPTVVPIQGECILLVQCL